MSAMVALALLVSAFAVSAQQAESGWAKGRPETDTAMKMAPVPAFPVQTATDRLCYDVGAPCNICDPSELAKNYRMDLDGSNTETVAQGARNAIGFDFDFDSKNGDLWFSENARDWLSEELPQNKLDPLPLSKMGANFGYPFCHPGSIPDPATPAR